MRLRQYLHRPRVPEWLRSLTVRAYLRYLAWTGQPIILGPFRSELGFEVLYWLPFLHWAQQYAGIPSERCIALSRGGMGHLYPATKAVDLYALRGVDQVRVENQADSLRRGKLKQEQVTPWDREVCREAAAQLGVQQYQILHPSWMYWLFDGFWEEQTTIRHVQRHTVYKGIPLITLPASFTLPKDFVAVRFYERATFPLASETAMFVRDSVRRLATHRPVVLLNQPHFTDDHTDLPVVGPNILQLHPPPAPEVNLLVQLAVLQRASCFIGTYGGVAQAALTMGKPSLSFFTQWGGTAQAHRHLSQWLSQMLTVPFEVSTLQLQAVWHGLMVGGVPQQTPPPPAVAGKQEVAA